MNLGQVYTKKIIANYMVDLLDLPKNSHIIDPCFGKGIFLESLKEKNYKNVTGIEIDSNLYNLVKEEFSSFELINKNFFSYVADNKIDGFILNPPYVRQEEIDDMNILGVTKERISTKCNEFNIYLKANLYLYFIARCISMLQEGGKMVAIYPNVWMNTPDGKMFLEQIRKKGCINNVIQIKGSPFVGNPLVDVMIMKFTKGKINDTLEETLLIKNNELIISAKEKAVNLCSIECVHLSSLAEIRRGVTTGFNNAFINPPLNIENILVDILSSPKDVKGYTTQKAKLDKLLSLSTINEFSNDITQYIKKMEGFILDKGKPKTIVNQIKEGRIWYKIIIPEIPDLIFPYIIRDKVRFIINEGKVIARDNFYTIRTKEDNFLMFALLNNLFVFSQLEAQGKSYGNGLLKIQKYDVDNLMIPNPALIHKTTKNKLINYAKKMILSPSDYYIISITKEISQYYKINNIEEIYKSQKNNRLQHVQ